MRNLLGGKGANLAEMNLIGVPVPPGFTITTEVCSEYYELGKDKVVELLKADVEKAIANIENLMNSKFGDVENPLLVSVRSGARASMPGMMDTILNLGLNDEVVEGLSRKTGRPRFAWDSYRRFVQMYGDVVLGMKPVNKEDIDPFEEIIEKVKEEKGVKLDNELEVEDLKELVKRFKVAVKEQTGQDFPTCAYEQLWGAICAVFRSWMNERAILYRKMEGIPAEWGTAVSVQAMVFGNMGDTSATGVCFSRDAGNGEDLFNGEYLINAQGEDVVAGIRTPQQITKIGSQRWAERAGISEEERVAKYPSMEEAMPEIYKELDALQTKLENHYRDMQDMEFTVQEGKLWFLQTRNGKRTGAAMVKIAMDLLRQGMIDEKTALERCEPNKLDELLHPVFDKKALKEAKVLTRGLPASPGAATGQIVFFADDAAKWAADGKKVVSLFHARQLHREADVFQAAALHQQVELLEDHGDVPAALSQGGGRQGLHRGAVDDDAALGGAFQQVDAAHQRGFARARHTNDAVDGAIGDGQVDVLQRIHRAVLHLESLRKVFDLDHSLLLSRVLTLDGGKAVLLAAVDAHRLDVDAGDRHQMGALFLIEVVQIRLMLEVVGVALAVLDDGVGDHIVVVLLNVQRDALGGQDVLADLQHLAVGSRGSRAADGLAVQCIVINGRIIAVGGVLDNRDDSALVVLIHEVLDLLALQSSHQSLDLGLVLVALLADQHVDVSRGAVFHRQSVGHGIQTSGDRIVGVNDSVVLILQDVGHLSSLDLIDGDVQGVLLDVVLGSGQAGVCLELEEAVLLQQGQSAGLVGGVVGDSDLDFVQLCHSGSRLRRSGRAGSSRGSGGGGRRTTTGGQGSGSSGHTGNFQKITTSNHSSIPSLLYKMFLDCTARHSSAPVHRKPPGNAKQKSSRPYGQTPCKDGSLKLPWYHLGLPHPHRYGLEAAAAGAELGSRGVQPDALTGVPVAGLALLHFAHAAPRPFSVPCFLPFSTVRALW